mmetsp:Transcript_14337/g.17426  ORF Transcript_14337/g.17426 Transcript_14337/m.17426 type:complete len:190 (-) Transcript_14337:414-983(-)
MSDQEQENNERDCNPLPTHLNIETTSRKRGWAGEEMEMKHKLYHLAAAASSSSTSKQEESTAVDLSQFRNHEVGSGYQAKGVIRQKMFSSNNDGNNDIKVIDMSKKLKTSTENDDIESKESDNHNSRDKKRKSKKHKRKKKEKREDESNEKDISSINEYLKCKGMRDFRKEIEKIMVEASSSMNPRSTK